MHNRHSQPRLRAGSTRSTVGSTRHRRSLSRRLLLASTALTAFAIGMVGSASEALAACTPNVTTSDGAVTINTVSSFSFRFENGGNATINIGAAGGDGTYSNNCVVDMVNRQNDTINITVPAVTTFDDAIVMDDATTGTVINVSNNLGAATNAILDGTGANTVNINAGANVSGLVALGGGADTLRFTGGTINDLVGMGAGNDTVFVDGTAWFFGGLPSIDGGADTDTLEFSVGSGTNSFFLDGDFTNVDFPDFENLIKSGDGGLRLQSDAGGDSFETITISGGTLTLIGTWDITGNTTTVNPGATLNIGAGTTTENGTTDILGALNVLSGGTFVANGVTAIDGGTLQIDAGGTYNANAAINGGANADTITVDGTLNAGGQTIDLMGGDDVMTVTGSLFVSTLNLGAGDDSLTFTSDGSLSVAPASGIDGGSNTGVGDTFTVNGGTDFAFQGLEFVTNFEHLVKDGTSTWVLSTSGGTATFETVTINQGTLVLVGDWSFTGNTTTVMPGATLDIGDGVALTVINEAGDTNVSGTLNVTNNATFNVDGTTTVFDGGTINIDAGGIMTVSVLDIQTGGTMNVDGTLQGTSGADTLTIDGALNAAAQTINLLGGGDVVTVSGTLTVGTLNFGGGNDMLTIDSSGVVNYSGFADGGANTDILVFTGTVDRAIFLAEGFTNFEDLAKNGTNSWSLTTSGGTATFETVTVNQGTLILVGNWSFTGNTTTVMPGATLDIGDGIALTVTNEAGDTNVSGTLNVTNNATFNSGDGAGDVTTVFDGGTINVNTGAMPGVLNAQEVDVRSGGTINVDGMMTATDTVVRGTINVNATGTYSTTGNTVLNDGGPGFADGGVINVMGGTYTSGDDAGDVTTLNLDSAINVTMGGTFIATGLTTVNFRAVVNVGGPSAGTYTAQALTVSNGGNFNVDDMGVATASAATLVTGGNLRVNAGGGYTANGTTTVSGGRINVSGTGTYVANGATTLNSGFIQALTGGSYTANNTTTVNGGFIDVEGTGSSYEANGATSVTGGGILVGGGGLYTANDTTTVSGGRIDVFDNGAYIAALTTTLDSGDIIVNEGTYTANGATIVNGGVLFVGGPGFYFANGGTTVNGGEIRGFGTIAGGTVMSNLGGAVTPGMGLNSIGTLFFVGTYNQHAGGAFQADIQPGGMSDLLLINGSAALGGAVQINTIAANFAPGDRFRIIQTNVPIPTIFDSAAISGAGVGDNVVWVGRVNDAGLFDVDDPSTGNNVDVLFAVNPANQPNLTPNQAAVAAAVGGAIADLPPGSIVIEDPGVYLATMVAAAGPNALDQIGGEVYDSFTAFSFNIARQFGGLVDTRVRTLRCASAAGPSAPFCGSGRTLLADGNQRADAGPGLAPGAPGTTSPNGFSPNTHPYGWSVWAQAIGSYISLDQTSTNLGYSGWTGGGAMGVDLALSQRWIVGVLAGGTRSNIDFSGVSGDGDLDAVTVGVYTAWYGSRWFANAAFTYTKTWVEADRDLTFMAPATTAKGKTEGDQYAIHSTIGYGFKIRRFSLEATGGVDWVQLRQYGFTETGAGAFNLTVGSRTDDSLRLRAGIRVARAWRVRPNLIISPSLRVGYAREVLDNTRAITSTLAGFGGSFTVNGDEGSRNILTYGGGIQADFSQGITLYFRHAGEWAGDRTSHTFNGGIRVRW